MSSHGGAGVVVSASAKTCGTDVETPLKQLSLAFCCLTWVGVVGCSVELDFPEDIIIECDSEQPCPEGYSCVEDINAQGVCVGSIPHCGNGVIEAQEVCDSGANNTNGYTIERVCNMDCTGFAPHCGDGEQQSAELCDAGEDNTDAYTVEPNCNTSCSGFAPRCGDAVIQPNEFCDDGLGNI